MKRIFTVSFIALAILISIGGAPHAALANASDSNNSYIQLNANGNPTGVTDGVTADPFADTAAGVAARTAAEKSPTDNKGNASDGYGSIMAWIASLFAWLVGVAALTLDYAVYYTIIRMGEYVHNLSAIGVTWRIFRDIGNIALIFGFLAIGISTILNTERLGWGQKMLPMLLVAAVFINFSLFFSEAVIDMGNIFATQFFTEINGGKQPDADFLTKTTIGSEGISNAIMAQVGLTNIYTQGRTNPDVFKGGNTWVVGFMSILLFIVTAFVMFSLAFILIARFVYLVFLIILAPLGFAGLAIPQLAARAKWWWDSLFEQTITAPVLLLLLYIALAVITDTQFLTGLRPPGSAAPSWTGFINGQLAGFGSLLLTFLIAMGLLLLVVIVAKNLSAVGASAVSNVMNSAKKKLVNTGMAPVRFAGRAASNTGRWAVRSTAGKGFHLASQAVRTSKVGQTQLGRIAAQTLDKGGKSYKDAKDKSVKMHEEYVKSVQTAIENKHAAATTDLARDRATAQAALDQVNAAHSAKDQPIVDEIKRLEQVVKDRKGTLGEIGATEDLKRAQKALEDQKNSAGRKAELTSAEQRLAAAKKEEDELNAAIKKKKTEAAISYADNIPKSITDAFIPGVGGALGLQWIAAGKGGNTAAMKIIKDAVKVESKDVKALREIMKQTLEAEEKEGGKKAEGAKPEGAKSEAGH